MWVQVPSSARKTQVVRLESFCVIGKIAIDAEDLVIGVMILELSNGCMNAYFEENSTQSVTWREGSAVAMSTRGKRYIRHLWEEQEKRRWKFKIDDISEG